MYCMISASSKTGLASFFKTGSSGVCPCARHEQWLGIMIFMHVVDDCELYAHTKSIRR